MKHKINIDNIPDEYKHLVKDEMTNSELSILGTILFKDKLSRLKNKILGWYYEKKVKKNNK